MRKELRQTKQIYKFGTDGLRGRANKELKPEQAYKIGRFIAWWFGDRGRKIAKIIIGKDTRNSSDMIESAIMAGIMSSGGKVYKIGVASTPCLMFLTNGFDAGVMITASHNPYYDNGIKLINSNGEKLEAKIINKLEKYISKSKDTLPFAESANIQKVINYTKAKSKYYQHIIETANINNLGKIKIAIDCANGSVSGSAEKIFKQLGINVYSINKSPNGYNINFKCGSTDISKLKKVVKNKKLDAGFAFDGDADRCIAIDNKGKVVDGDKLLYILAKYYKQKNMLNKDTVVSTIISNYGLETALSKYGIKLEKTDVGDKNIYKRMVMKNYTLGGEPSGHVIINPYTKTGDGILTAIKIIETIANTKQSISEQCQEMQVFPQYIININVKNKELVIKNGNLKNIIKKEEANLNGIGKIIVRASGTENKIRILVESCTKEQSKKIANKIRKAILQI